MKPTLSKSKRFAASFRTLPFLCAFLFSADLGVAAEEAADALKQRVLAQARKVSADDFAWTRTVRTEESDGSKTEQHVVVEKYDPAKPADQRWTFVSKDGRPPTAEEETKYRNGLPTRRVPNYGRVAEYFGAPATSALDKQGRTVLSFATLPKGSLLINDADISANSTAQSTIDASGEVPFVEQTRFTSTKPTRVKLVAKIERMEATARYRMMPNGKPAPAESVTDMTGSMMGKSGRIHTVATFSEQRAVR